MILHYSNTLIGSGHKEIIVWYSSKKVFNLKGDSYLYLRHNQELKDRKSSQKRKSCDLDIPQVHTNPTYYIPKTQ